jgi:DNA-binding HxlR family transcriptional regulator
MNNLLQVLASIWTTQILRLLSQKSFHFSAIKRNIAGISAKVLTARLRQLEGLGLIERRVIPSSPPTVHYKVTALGSKVCSVLDQLDNVMRPETAALQSVISIGA